MTTAPVRIAASRRNDLIWMTTAREANPKFGCRQTTAMMEVLAAPSSFQLCQCISQYLKIHGITGSLLHRQLFGHPHPLRHIMRLEYEEDIIQGGARPHSKSPEEI
jgi:hypothetical protein